MHFPSENIPPSTAYQLLVSTIIPRPIAFVTTVNLKGHLNAAPFSFFNAMGSEPPVVALGFEPNANNSLKDTPKNILETQEFVVNIVDEALSTQMNQCAGSFPPEVDELELAEIATIQSISITPPRIQASPVSLECRMINSMDLKGGGIIIAGEVIHFHIRDEIILATEPLKVDINKLSPISRLNGPHYGRITDQFSINRP